MKKYLFILAFLVASTCLFSQKPLIKFYLTNKDFKTYNLNELQSIQLLNTSDSLQMQVFCNNGSYYYPAKVIDSIAFVTTSGKISAMNVVINGTVKIYNLSSIDSILFYYTKYTATTICNQVWMTKNLDVDHYMNGDSIPEVNNDTVWSNLKTGAWCYYDKDPVRGAIYGKLYNWYAVNDPRGLAPVGWQLPTKTDWIELTECLGIDTLAGGKLKSIGTLEDRDGLWNTPNTGATNETGFSALPAGARRDAGYFFSLGYYTAWWASTSLSEPYALFRFLNYSSAELGAEKYNMEYGFSVRCVRYPVTIPFVLNHISPNAAFMRDNVIITGSRFGAWKGTSTISFMGANANEILSWSDTLIALKVPKGAKTGKVFLTVYGVKSNEIDFTVKSSQADDTVKICHQVWMTKNLDVDRYRNGDLIPQVANPSTWANLKTGAWCYPNNDSALGAIYGKLYNGYAINDPRGLAPVGWRIPTFADWKELDTCLGDTRVSGGKLKSTGTIQDGNGQWQSPNAGATNESGFSALPAGMRIYNGLFYYISMETVLSSSTVQIDQRSISKNLYYDETGFNWGISDNTRGISVRCVKE